MSKQFGADSASSGGIKSIQRGVISSFSGATGTATITSVVTANSELRYLGGHAADGGGTLLSSPYLVLTNATTITATRQYALGSAAVSWELTERY